MQEQIELNLRAELDKPKLAILSSDLDEVSIGFKTKMGREDAQSVMCDLHHLVGKLLNVRLLECVAEDDSQLDLFPNRFANLDRERLIMAVEEFEAIAKTIQRLAFEATATQTVYGIPIMDMEELLGEIEGALKMTGADHFKRPNPEPEPSLGGVEGRSFENAPQVIKAALEEGWSLIHPHHGPDKVITTPDKATVCLYRLTEDVQGAAETDATDAQEADTATQADTDAGEVAERDELYEDAKALIVYGQTASATMLQKNLKIGSNRVARLMDDLETGGVVGPATSGKAREILISTEEHANKTESPA